MEASLTGVIVQYSFWVGFSAMAAGVLYFALERQSLVVEYQPVATLCAAVALIAAINYWEMKDLVIAADAGDLRAFADFPTHFRYIDWLLTTPLLLAVIPVLIGLGPQTKGLMVRLLIADVIMIAAGYLGETSINAEMGATIVGWLGFAVAVLAFGFIIFTLYATLTAAETRVEPERARALNTLKAFISIGWLVYPLGFLLTLLFDGVGAAALREFVYNVADVLTKVGFGMIAVSAAKTASYVPKETRA
jgi:bacteriorhodopsin